MEATIWLLNKGNINFLMVDSKSGEILSREVLYKPLSEVEMNPGCKPTRTSSYWFLKKNLTNMQKNQQFYHICTARHFTELHNHVSLTPAFSYWCSKQSGIILSDLGKITAKLRSISEGIPKTIVATSSLFQLYLTVIFDSISFLCITILFSQMQIPFFFSTSLF